MEQFRRRRRDNQNVNFSGSSYNSDFQNSQIGSQSPKFRISSPNTQRSSRFDQDYRENTASANYYVNNQPVLSPRNSPVPNYRHSSAEYSQNSTPHISRHQSPRPQQNNRSKYNYFKIVSLAILIVSAIITTALTILFRPRNFCMKDFKYNGCRICPKNAVCGLSSFQCNPGYRNYSDYCVEDDFYHKFKCIRKPFQFTGSNKTMRLTFEDIQKSCQETLTYHDIQNAVDKTNDMYVSEKEPVVTMVRVRHSISFMFYITFVLWTCVIIATIFHEQIFSDLY